MNLRSHRTLYVLLFFWIAISMSYYVAGVSALYQKRIHPEQHVRLPFDLGDEELNLHSLENRAKAAGLQEGDAIETFEGQPYTGDYQLSELMRRARPGEVLRLGVARTSGHIQEASLPLPPAKWYEFDFQTIAYYTGVLTVSLLGLLAGYWVVAARPTDPNAWLALALFTFWEAGFGDIQAAWWGGTSYVIFGFWQEIVGSAALPALLWFGLFFPERSRIDRKWPSLKWLIVAVEIGTLCFAMWIIYLHNFAIQRLRVHHLLWSWVKRVGGWTDAVCIIVFLIAVFDALRSASTPDARRRLRVLAAGSAFSFGPVLIIFGILPFFGYEPPKSLCSN